MKAARTGCAIGMLVGISVSIHAALAPVQLAWSRDYGGSLTPTDAAADRAGNVYVMGYNGGLSEVRCELVKYSAAGQQLWVAAYRRSSEAASLAQCLTVDGNGSVLVGAYSRGTATDSADFTVLKYAPSGDLLWARYYESGTNTWGEATAIAVDGSGNVYAVGETGPPSNDELILVKYSSTGAQRWVSKTAGPTAVSHYAREVALDPTGNIFLAGVTASMGHNRSALLKYDSEGRLLWRVDHALSGYVQANGTRLAVASDGSVFVAWEHGTLKYDGLGRLLWSSERPSGGVVLDSSGNVYVIEDLCPAFDRCGSFVSKYDARGRRVWSGRNRLGLIGPRLDAEGNVYVSSKGNSAWPWWAKFDSTGNRVADAGSLYSESFYTEDFEIDPAGTVYLLGNPDMATLKYTQNPVAGLPILVAGPQSQQVEPDAQVTFTVSATGEAPLSYQWLYEGDAMRGETQAVLVVESALPSRVGGWAVAVSNAVGVVVSPEAFLTLTAPIITAQPEGLEVQERAPFELSVGATGAATLQFQWFLSGQILPAATNRILKSAAASMDDGGDYRVLVSNAFGSTTSQVAHVKIYSLGELNSWSVRLPVASEFSLESVTYGGGLFVAVGYQRLSSTYRGVILTSTDGAVWTERFSRQELYFRDVSFGNGTFVAASGIESIYCTCPGLVTSTNGMDWVVRSIDYSYPLYVTGYGHGKLIVAGGAHSQPYFWGSVLSSANTLDWEVRYLGDTGWFSGLAMGMGTSVLVGSASLTSPGILWSTNGTEWRAPNPLPPEITSRSFKDVAFEFSHFVALGGIPGQTEILSSVDGKNWNIESILEDSAAAIAHGYGTYVALGRNGRVWSSASASRWSLHFQTNYLQLTDVVAGRGTFVAVGGGGVVIQSGPFEAFEVSTAVQGQGSVRRSPEKPLYRLGESVTLTAVPGHWQVFMRWNDAVTSNPRVVVVGETNHYTAQFGPPEEMETLTFGGVSRTAPFGVPAIFVDGEFFVGGDVARVGSTEVSILTTFPHGSIFYTLDGTAPDFGGRLYTGPFVLTRSATVRAIGYDASFLTAWEADPVHVHVQSTLGVHAFSAGGGSVGVSPDPPYQSDSMVTLTALPESGWTFLQWLGDTAGTNSITSVRVPAGDLCAQAVFGTSLATSVAGAWAVTVSPPLGPHAYGLEVRLTAVPAPGHYFGAWGNAVMSTSNPVLLPMTNAQPTVSCVFGVLPPDQVALTVQLGGHGRVTTNPRGHRFLRGQPVSLHAVPVDGQDFLGWTGDAAGTSPDLSVVLNESSLITANFTRRPKLVPGPCSDGWWADGFAFTLIGDAGERYRVEQSNELKVWTTIGQFTNKFGILQVTDGTTGETQRFYRAVIEEP